MGKKVCSGSTDAFRGMPLLRFYLLIELAAVVIVNSRGEK